MRSTRGLALVPLGPIVVGLVAIAGCGGGTTTTTTRTTTTAQQTRETSGFARLPTHRCATKTGIEQGAEPLGAFTTVPMAPVSGVDLTAYRGIQGTTVVAPSGWHCSALVGVDGNETVEVYPGQAPSDPSGALPRNIHGGPEHFEDGALIDTRVRIVRTDSDGRWKERLPGGPSRTVSAAYAGNRRYLAEATTAGALRVKTKASLHISNHRVREGHRVAFKGRIGHLAARIPPSGKLVELEVKDGKRWHTVRHPFYTKANGKYRLTYRFARFYVSNVRYRFRVRVIRERNWPYKAPVSSRVRKLVVKAH